MEETRFGLPDSTAEVTALMPFFASSKRHSNSDIDSSLLHVCLGKAIDEIITRKEIGR